MKKVSSIALAALISGGALGEHSVFAENGNAVNAEIISIQTEEATNFIKYSGVISKVNKSDQSFSLTVQKPEDSLEMIFPITDEVLLLDIGTTDFLQKETLQEGVTVDVYYDKNKPMPMIYPATITPEIVVVKVEGQMGSVKIAKFDQNFLSLDNELKLNLGKETILLNEQGEVILEKDLHGKELIVFYTITTRSIPAQTPPEKIIALDNEHPEEVQQIISEDHFMKNGVKMIPIRKVSEALGFDVEWLSKTGGISVRKQNMSLHVTVGKTDYGYNRSLRYFEVVPEIKNGKTYVAEEFLEFLKE